MQKLSNNAVTTVWAGFEVHEVLVKICEVVLTLVLSLYKPVLVPGMSDNAVSTILVVFEAHIGDFPC